MEPGDGREQRRAFSRPRWCGWIRPAEAGKRDRAILAVLVGCGLRRDEAVRLTFEHIQQRDGRWCVVDSVGKKGRVRTVPIPAWTEAAIRVQVTAYISRITHAEVKLKLLREKLKNRARPRLQRSGAGSPRGMGAAIAVAARAARPSQQNGD